jgi:uncharacterized protein (DUF58 family)
MLPEELMKQVRQLQIHTRRIVRERFSGEYSSAFKGQGMEFAEVREYQPGDDIRTIDWNVTARTNVPYIKKYVEERELTVVFAVDMSASGQFGTRERLKNRMAAEVCAVLAFAAIQNNDKVGLVIFTDEVEVLIPPKKGSRHALRIVRDLLNYEPKSSQTDIVSSMEFMSRVFRRHAVMFLVSDFLVPEVCDPIPRRVDPFEKALRLLRRRHDVVALRVLDAMEQHLVNCGLVDFEDAETGERFTLDTGSSRVRRAFEQQAREADARLVRIFDSLGIDHVELVTGQEYLTALIALFHRREHRR